MLFISDSGTQSKRSDYLITDNSLFVDSEVKLHVFRIRGDENHHAPEIVIGVRQREYVQTRINIFVELSYTCPILLCGA